MQRGRVSRLRSQTGDSRYWSDYDKTEHTLLQATVRSIYVPFRECFASSSVRSDDGAVPIELLLTDRMALLLDTW